MKSRVLLALFSLFFIIIFSNCSKENEETGSIQKTSLQRGEYLVASGHCDDCHTPKKMTDKGPVPDRSNRFMGYPEGRPLPEVPQSSDWVYFTPDLLAAVGPWGTTFSANITPSDTGIGNWTYEQFSNSLKKGMHKGIPNGRPVLPPMPWQNTAQLTEDDLKAMFDYLQTIPPIENRVPSAILATEN